MQRLALTLRDADQAPAPFVPTSAAFNSMSSSLNMSHPFTSPPQLRTSFLAPFNSSPPTNGHQSSKDKSSTLSGCNQNQQLSDTPIDLSALPPPSKRLKVEKEDDDDVDDDHVVDDSPEESNHHHHQQQQNEFHREVITPRPIAAMMDESGSAVAAGMTPTTTMMMMPKMATAMVTAATTTAAAVATTTQIFKQETELSLSPSSTPTPQPESTDQRSKAEEEIGSWTVNHVCDFVASIDICAEYEQNFRDQCIDGTSLMLLSEVHLTGSLGMKLGPALKLRSMLSKRINELR